MATSLEDISSLRLWKGIIAEFLGTLLLTMIGCGSCIQVTETPPGVVQVIAINEISIIECYVILVKGCNSQNKSFRLFFL